MIWLTCGRANTSHLEDVGDGCCLVGVKTDTELDSGEAATDISPKSSSEEISTTIQPNLMRAAPRYVVLLLGQLLITPQKA